MRRKNYETDNETFSANAYQVDGHKGIAWRVLGWEMEWKNIEWNDECSDCYEEQEECRTDRVICVMIGDDRHWSFDPEDVHAIAREDYCGECGQMGCTHDAYDRGEA